MTLGKQLAALLDAAREAEESLSWVVERGGQPSLREEPLEHLRAAIRAFQPDFLGPLETCRGCNGVIQPAENYCDGCSKNLPERTKNDHAESTTCRLPNRNFHHSKNTWFLNKSEEGP